MGMYLREENKKSFLYFVCLFVCGIFLYIGKTGFYIEGLNKEILFGIIIGMPVIYSLKSFARNRVDLLLGNMSYGIYLNHFTVKTVIVNIIGHEPNVFSEWFILLCLLAFFSVISYYVVDYPIKMIKIRQRNKS